VSEDYASGDLIYYGQGSAIPNKHYDVKEAYVEFKMPLVQDKPGIKALNFETGYRYSDYSISGGVSAYKFGADYAPVQGLRFRANFQRSVRAPNLYELYLPKTLGTGNLGTDPAPATTSRRLSRRYALPRVRPTPEPPVRLRSAAFPCPSRARSMPTTAATPT
jgi:hypothetical protein